MNKIMKRVAAMLLAILLTFSLAGCYSENLTWSAKMGDTTLPIGAYIYYLSSAYSEAATMIDSETKVLDGAIDGKDAEDWILDRTMLYVNQYFWMEQKMEELGLEMTDTDYGTATGTTTSYWSEYGDIYESIGVAKSSFDLTFSQYNIKALKVFEVMYGEGGEHEISEDEIEAYFTDTYYNYEYFTVPMVLPDAAGDLVDMTAEEIEALEDQLDEVKTKIEKGKLTVEEAAVEYGKTFETESTENEDEEENSSSYVTEINSEATFAYSYLPTSVQEALMEMEDGDVAVLEDSGYKIVFRRLPIEDRVDDVLENADNRLNLMVEMKQEEFQAYTKEEAADFEGVELNEKAIKRYQPKMFAEDVTEYGTAVAETEDTAE